MREKNIKDLEKIYRITLVEDNTHERIGSLKISLLWAIIYGIAITVGVILIIYSCIVFTPLKTLIPGYPDAHSKKVAISNAIKIDSLESAIIRWEIYSENLARVLDGKEVLNRESLMRNSNAGRLSNEATDYLRLQDSILRAKTAEDAQFMVSHKEERNLPIDGRHFFTPLKGVVSAPFEAGIHPFVEISSAAGAVIMSVLDGSVVSTQWNVDEGYSLTVQHSGDIISVYRSTAEPLRKTGDKVAAGTPIALSDGSCEFELWSKGERVNPSKYINL